MHSLGIVQWNSSRRDHSGNPGGVSGSGPVTRAVPFLGSGLTPTWLLKEGLVRALSRSNILW